jgi:hypothetical protein
MAVNMELFNRYNPKCASKRCKQYALYAIDEAILAASIAPSSNIRDWLFNIDTELGRDELERERDKWCCKKCLFRKYITEDCCRILCANKYLDLYFEEHRELKYSPYSSLTNEQIAQREIIIHKCYTDAEIDAKKTVALIKTLVKTI